MTNNKQMSPEHQARAIACRPHFTNRGPAPTPIDYGKSRVRVDVCPVCKLPAHASETDDEGRHPHCA